MLLSAKDAISTIKIVICIYGESFPLSTASKLSSETQKHKVKCTQNFDSSLLGTFLLVTKLYAHLAFRKAALRSSVALSLLVHFVPCGGRLRRCSTPWGHGVKKIQKEVKKSLKKRKKMLTLF